MNKLLNDYQLLQLENAELRNRIAELKAKPQFPSEVLTLHAIVENGKTYYQILDECGYNKATFCTDSDDEAKQIFLNYKKNFKPALIEVIANGYDGKNFHCLTRVTYYVLRFGEIVQGIYYSVKWNKQSYQTFDDCSIDDAIEKYNTIIANKQINKSKENTSRVLI